MISKPSPHPLSFLIGGLVLIIGAALVVSLSSMNNPVNDPIACTLDARVCPDGSYVGRTGPNCEFEDCPDGPITIPPGKLPSHETLAAVAKCESVGMQWINGTDHSAWKCDTLPTGNVGSFAPEIVYYSDMHAYGFDFPALTYQVPFTVDQEVDAIYTQCIQICVGTRLMAYVNGEWNSIDSLEELKQLSGTIDSEAEALAFARYATGMPAGDEIELDGQVTEVTMNAEGNYEVNLFPHEGGICCGSDYVFYTTTYVITKNGDVTEKSRTQAGIVPNSAIA